jgi:hypothetical protein
MATACRVSTKGMLVGMDKLVTLFVGNDNRFLLVGHQCMLPFFLI